MSIVLLNKKNKKPDLQRTGLYLNKEVKKL